MSKIRQQPGAEGALAQGMQALFVSADLMDNIVEFMGSHTRD
jgi:hypothetical protein